MSDDSHPLPPELEAPPPTPAVQLDAAALDLKACMVQPNFGVARVKKVLTGIPVCKPAKSFIRAMPRETWQTFMTVWRKKSLVDFDESFLIIPPALLEYVPADLLSMTTFVAYQTKEGDVGVFPVKLPTGDRKPSDWSVSALEVLEKAVDHWTRFESGAGRYHYSIAGGISAAPTFGEMTAGKIFDLAFKGHVVDSSEHHALRELRGDE